MKKGGKKSGSRSSDGALLLRITSSTGRAAAEEETLGFNNMKGPRSSVSPCERRRGGELNSDIGRIRCRRRRRSFAAVAEEAFSNSRNDDEANVEHNLWWWCCCCLDDSMGRLVHSVDTERGERTKCETHRTTKSDYNRAE